MRDSSIQWYKKILKVCYLVKTRKTTFLLYKIGTCLLFADIIISNLWIITQGYEQLHGERKRERERETMNVGFGQEQHMEDGCKTYHFYAFLSFLLFETGIYLINDLKWQENLSAYLTVVYLSFSYSATPMKLNVGFTFNRSLVTLKFPALTVISKY